MVQRVVAVVGPRVHGDANVAQVLDDCGVGAAAGQRQRCMPVSAAGKGNRRRPVHPPAANHPPTARRVERVACQRLDNSQVSQLARQRKRRAQVCVDGVKQGGRCRQDMGDDGGAAAGHSMVQGCAGPHRRFAAGVLPGVGDELQARY